MTTPTTPPTPETPGAPGTPEPRETDSLADEVFPDDGRTAALPTTNEPEHASTGPLTDAPAATPGATDTMTSTAPAHVPAPAPIPERQWLSGPAPFALVLGILGLLVAGSVLLGELTDLNLPSGDLGPWSVVAAGLVVLLVGAIGLRSSRSRH